MTYKLKYYCDFRAIDNTMYRLEIKEYTSATLTPKEVKLIADSAELQHEPVGYLDKLIYPTLSFTLLSEENFQFHSLYSSDIKKHKVLLYKSGNLIFTGYIDPEVYEEDYSTTSNYEVNINCSTVGMLDRVESQLHDMMTLKDIVATIMQEIDINNIEWDVAKKGVVDSELIAAENLSINTDLFRGKEKNDSYKEILEEISNSFGAYFFLYDNKLLITDRPTSHGSTFNIDSNIINSATLEVAKTYKDIAIIYDPNIRTTIEELALDYDDFATITPSSTVHYQMPKDTNYRSFSVQQFTGKEYDKIKVLTDNQLTADGVNYRASRIIPSFSGAKDAFVCHSWGQNGEGSNRTNRSVCWYNNSRIGNRPILETSLIPITATGGDKWFINLQLNTLISACWNALEPAEVKNDKGNDSDFQNWCNFIYLPGDIELCDAEGKVLYYYDNSRVVAERGWNQTYAGWTKVTRYDNTYPNGKYFFSYYDNRKNSTPFKNSFAKNSLSCGYTGKDEDIPLRHEKMKGQGDIIPLPPIAGYLRIRVRSGLEAYDSGMIRMSALMFKIKHMWYKDITVRLTDMNGVVDNSDDEYLYKGTLDNYAENSEEINVKIGNVGTLDTHGLGSLYHNDRKIKGFKLSTTDELEPLAVKVLKDYGNIFDSKKRVIKAVMKDLPMNNQYTSNWFTGSKFIITGKYHNLMASEAETTLIEYP